jgi:hypothetical protein
LPQSGRKRMMNDDAPLSRGWMEGQTGAIQRLLVYLFSKVHSIRNDVYRYI